MEVEPKPDAGSDRPTESAPTADDGSAVNRKPRFTIGKIMFWTAVFAGALVVVGATVVVVGATVVVVGATVVAVGVDSPPPQPAANSKAVRRMIGLAVRGVIDTSLRTKCASLLSDGVKRGRLSSPPELGERPWRWTC